MSEGQLADLAVQEMLPAIKKKLIAQDFESLGQLAQRVSALDSRFQSAHRDARFQKSAAIADSYDPYTDDEEEAEIDAAEWTWSRKPVSMP